MHAFKTTTVTCGTTSSSVQVGFITCLWLMICSLGNAHHMCAVDAVFSWECTSNRGRLVFTAYHRYICWSLHKKRMNCGILMTSTLPVRFTSKWPQAFEK